MELGIRGAVAVVTGGSRGLGRAICESLGAEGVRVCINYRARAEAAQAVAARLRSAHNVDAALVQGDVSKGDDVRGIFDTAESSLGCPDILVNNAATWPTARVADMTEAEWNETLAVNLGGPFLCCREAVRRWRKHGRGGVIVNVSSQAAFYGATTGHAHYAAAKAGLVNFTMSLARETAAEGIRVNAVAPGFMSTDMIGDLREDETARCLARIPMGRIADPREVADVVTFLASARAGYMTGATVCVTGGMLMR